MTVRGLGGGGGADRLCGGEEKEEVMICHICYISGPYGSGCRADVVHIFVMQPVSHC